MRVPRRFSTSLSDFKASSVVSICALRVFAFLSVAFCAGVNCCFLFGVAFASSIASFCAGVRICSGVNRASLSVNFCAGVWGVSFLSWPVLSASLILGSASRMASNSFLKPPIRDSTISRTVCANCSTGRSWLIRLSTVCQLIASAANNLRTISDLAVFSRLT